MKPKQKRALITISAVWILTALLLLFATNSFAQNRGGGSGNVYSQLQLFSEVLMKLKQNYVTDLSDEELIEAAIKGMLDSTDPHTNYFTADEFKDFTTSTKGSFGGLGIQIDKIGDYITVVSPIEGTPAYKMGITAGDKIIKVDGKSVVGMTTDESIKHMRGDVGTTVVITILRPGVAEPIDFTIVREVIKIKSVPYYFKAPNGTGYMRISQFNENTTSEVREALKSLEAEGINGLIVDLRFNPGGLLDQAVDTVNEFIGGNKLVVETKGRTRQDALYTRYNTKERNYPIIVMVNEASASASEIFAGSLQDWDKGLVVGKNTFGKGSVQQLLPLTNGNGIKITTSYYYIKSGRCIHKMSNDKRLKGKEVSKDELNQEDAENHNKIYYTSQGREVFGGGGISPDIELENEFLTKFAAELRRKNLFFNFAVDYLTEHDNKIAKNPVITDKMMQDFLSYAKKNEVSYTLADLDSARAYIENTLKSEMVRKVYGDLEAYKITALQDRQLQQTLDIFDRYKTLKAMYDYADSLKKKKR